MRTSVHEIVCRAWKAKKVVPSLNIPYLPMMEPIVNALRDTGSFGLIAAANLEFNKFSTGSTCSLFEEYLRVRDERFTRLHLDHVPVIDEDAKPCNYLEIIGHAVEMGYDSVMVDGSRLKLEENIGATRKVVALAHARGIAVEAELGAVLGHESGPLPPYEELFASRKGFTDPQEAGRFARETGVDWLSVSIGNIHGAISGVAKSEKKPQARLSIGQLDRIAEQTGIPLVLHGGSGISRDSIQEGIRHGIAKINVGTTLRQAYEASRNVSVATAQQAVYRAAMSLLADELETSGSAKVLEVE